MIYKGTSEPEQAIYYYVKRYFPEAVNRFIYSHDCSIDKGVEIDVYIPSIGIAIEYDGGFWHDKKDENDALKNRYLNQYGIFIIRIRDLNLPKLPEFMGKIFYHGKAPDGMHTNECIESVLHELANHCNNNILANQLLNFSLSFELYINDLPDIISNMFPVKVKNNKSTFCGAEFWDNKANGKLKLKNIPAYSQGFYVNFKCKNGKNIHSTIDILVDKKKCNRLCQKCFNEICLFSWNCQEKECPIILNYFNDYLSGKVQSKINTLSSAYANFFSSSLIFSFIIKRLEYQDDELIRRFNQLFYFPRFGLSSVFVNDLEELKIVNAYAEIGGLVTFNFDKLDCNNDCLELLDKYFAIVYNNLYRYNKESQYSNECWYFIDSIFRYWKQQKNEMNLSAQKIIVDFLKSVEANITKHNFKYE